MSLKGIPTQHPVQFWNLSEIHTLHTSVWFRLIFMGFPCKPQRPNYPLVGITFIADILFCPEYPLDAVTLVLTVAEPEIRSAFVRRPPPHVVDCCKPKTFVIKEFLKKRKDILSHSQKSQTQSFYSICFIFV